MKSLKFSPIVILIVLMVFTLSGCARNSLGGGETGDGDVIVIKIGHTDSETRSTNTASLMFKEYMEENTDGRVSVEVYPNGQLGDDEDLVKAVKLGTCQLYIGAQGVVSGLLGPQLDILDLPFLYDGYDSWYRGSFENGGLALYNAQLEGSGYVNLDFQYDGMRNMLTVNKAIRSVEDLGGLKIRANNNELYLSTYKNLGANPTPMAFGEVYTGLSQGTVDGVDHVLGVMVDQKFYEPASYCTLTNHIVSPLVVLSSSDFVDSLPDDIQQVFYAGVKEMSAAQRELEYDAEQESIRLLEEAGIEIIELSPEARADLEEAVQPVYEQWREAVGDDLIDRAMAVADKQRS